MGIIKKQISIKKNFSLNLVKTIMNLLFSLISFSYSARIWGVNIVGKISFTRSFTQYFIVLAMLGINAYGIRECAKIRENKDELSKLVHELLFVNLIATIISYILFALCIFSIHDLIEYRDLLMLFSITIFLNAMGLEWLYSAEEDYMYITMRSVLFQLIALVAMLIFVKNSADLYKYSSIYIFATSGSYVLNFLHCRKYITIKWYGKYQLKKHIKPIAYLFAFSISIVLYTALDSTMLGFVSGVYSVGIYTAGIKLNKIVQSLITCLGVVVMPRLSYYFECEEKSKFNNLVKKSYSFVFMMSVPISIGIFMLSEPLVILLSGNEFRVATVTSMILTPIILFIPFSVLTNNQILIPMRKDRLVLSATSIGAIVNFIANMVLIPQYAENGAAVGTVLAEGIVMSVCYYNASKYFDMKKIFRGYWKYWVAAIPIPIIEQGARYIFTSNLIVVSFTIIVSAILYFCILLLLKNELVLEGYFAVINFFKGMRKQQTNN